MHVSYVKLPSDIACRLIWKLVSMHLFVSTLCTKNTEWRYCMNAVTWFALIVIYLGVVSSYRFETFIVIMNIFVVIIVTIIIIRIFIVVLSILSPFLFVLILLLIPFLFIIFSIIIITIIMVIITHRLSCVQNKLKKNIKDACCCKYSITQTTLLWEYKTARFLLPWTAFASHWDVNRYCLHSVRARMIFPYA